MATVLDKLRRKNNKEEGWSKSGSFMNKPMRGWLHPDSQLDPQAGVCYGVRYVGNLEVKTSMKTLDFETRTLVAKESISRVCEAAGFKTVTKKRKTFGVALYVLFITSLWTTQRATPNNDKRLNKLLGGMPGMMYAGANVNLTISTDSLNLMVMESGEIVADHEMPGISFASGGDPDTMDYVAYIAKDVVNGRACHVLECGGGLAQDVITTIGQAFELRFKLYLQKQPKPVNLPEKFDNPNSADSWGNEPDYYNDRPEAMAPSPNGAAAASLPPEYAEAEFNDQVNEDMYASVKERKFVNNLINLDDQGAVGGMTYDNTRDLSEKLSQLDDFLYDNKNSPQNPAALNGHAPSSGLDAFSMVPFTESLPSGNIPNSPGAVTDLSPGSIPNSANSPHSKTDLAPYHEEWFHGKLTRHQAEELLLKDGDFLVRESTNTSGQYVLSGRLNNKKRHLLLVDPQGVVRTMDRTFDSVTHLVTFHLDNGLPIVSQDSELVLKYPVINSDC